MSVIKSKRSVSQMEFLHKARELEIYTIKKCINFPKRYTFHFTQFLTESSVRIYENVKKQTPSFPRTSTKRRCVGTIFSGRGANSKA